MELITMKRIRADPHRCGEQTLQNHGYISDNRDNAGRRCATVISNWILRV
jgi:hypothetical protein